MNPEWRSRSPDFALESPVIVPLDFSTADAGLTAQPGGILIPFAHLMALGHPTQLVRETDEIYATVATAALVLPADSETERRRRS